MSELSSIPSGGPHEYVLGTDAAELSRLGLQHRLWSDAAHSLWRLANLQPGQRALDVGSGPGFATFDIAQVVAGVASGATGEVVAVDESGPYLAHVASQAAARGLSNVQTVQRDVMRLLDGPTGSPPLAPGSFDFAYARWVLCFVSDPGAVVRGVHALLRPGGRWAIQDYFNYESMTLAPRVESFSRAVRATGQSWRARGGDPDIVGRLPGLLSKAGFCVVHLDVHQRIARPGSPMWQWPTTFWTNFLPVLVRLGLLTQEDQAEWERDWARVSQDSSAFALLPPVFDLVAERL